MGRLPLPRTSMDASRSYYSSSAGGGQYRQGYASSSLQLTDGNARSGVSLFAEHHPQQQHGRSLSFTHQGLQPPHVLPNSHNPHSQGNFNGGNTQQTGRQPAGNGADDSEFVNIAETLTKLTPRPNPSPPANSTTAIASSIALVPGLLPPITGESFVGNLPSLNVLGPQKTNAQSQSNASNTQLTQSNSSAQSAFSVSFSQLADSVLAFPMDTNILPTSTTVNSTTPTPHPSSTSRVELPGFRDVSEEISSNSFDAAAMPLFPVSRPQQQPNSVVVLTEQERVYEERLKQLIFGRRVRT